MERLLSMEKDIRYLLGKDKEAQEKLHGSQQRRQQMADEMTTAREALQKKKQDDAQRQVDAAESQQKQAYEQELARLRVSYDAALKDLEEKYEANHLKWVETIKQRCLQ